MFRTLGVLLGTALLLLALVPQGGLADHWNSSNNPAHNPAWVHERKEPKTIAVDISLDGKYIVSGTGGDTYYTHKVFLFHRDSGTPLWHTENSSNINSVSLSADGEHIVTGVGYFTRLYHRRNNTPVWEHHNPSDRGANQVAISADGKYIVSANDENCYFFSSDNATPLWSTNLRYARYVAITANGSHALIAGGGGTQALYVRYFTMDGSQLWSYRPDSAVTSVGLSADGTTVGISISGARVLRLNHMSGNMLWEYGRDKGFYGACFMDVSADGKYVGAANRGNNEGKLFRLLSENGTAEWIMNLPEEVRVFAMSADGKVLAGGTNEGNIFVVGPGGKPLWNSSTGNPILALALPGNSASIVAGNGAGKTFFYAPLGSSSQGDGEGGTPGFGILLMIPAMLTAMAIPRKRRPLH